MSVKRYTSILIVFSLFFTTAALAATKSSGQLYEEARKHFSHKEYKNATYSLEEIMLKHPGSKEFLDAHILFAICQTRQNTSKKAIQPLQYYIQAKKWTTESLRARLLLGHAFLDQKMFHEALLTSLEIQNQKQKLEIPIEIFLESLLIKAWSHLGLNQTHKAQLAIDSFKIKSNNQDSLSDLKTQASLFEIELKLDQCNRINNEKKQSETSSVKNLQKHGSCFLEALIDYQNALGHGSLLWINKATFSIQNGWYNYLKACNNVPKPLKKSSKLQTKRYKNELLSLFLKTCRQNQSAVLKMLEKWNRNTLGGNRFYIEKLSKVFIKPIKS